MLLGGEPGIGKSRLADETAQRAQEAGFRVLWGRAWEDAGAPPYWPWVQVLRAYVRSVEASVALTQLGPGASDVAQMLPELRTAYPDLPPPADTASDSARFQLFDSTAAFLRNAADAAPLLVVLDDLHAADTPSMLLLRFLASQLTGMRLLVIGTFRDLEVTQEHPLAATIEQLKREPATRVLILRGLRPRAVGRLVEASVGVDLSPGAVSALSTATAGNPLFLREAVRLLAAEDRLTDVAGGATFRLAIPPGIREVMKRRVAHLGDASVELLTAAAAIGPEFGVETLIRLTGMRPADLYDALDGAERAGLVTPTVGLTPRFRFSHDLVRETLYDSLPSSARSRLHRSIAEALEADASGSGEPHLAELAHHYFEAAQAVRLDSEPGGEPARDRARTYATRAAEQAAASLAFEEAARLYRMALTLLDADRSSDQERAAILLAIGDAEGRAGDLLAARATLLEAATISRRIGSASHLARAALWYGGRFVWARAGDDPHIIGLLQDALALLGGQEEHLRVRLLARLACAWRDSPAHRDQSDALSREALRMARELGDPSTLSYALVGRFGAVYWPDNADERLAIAEELLDVAEAAADAERIVDAHMTLTFVYSDLGRTASARREYQALVRLARQLRQPAQLWLATAFGAEFALMQGDYAEAERLMAQESQPGAPQTFIRDDVSAMRMHRFLITRERGRLEDEEATVRASTKEFPWYPAHRAALACLLADLGRLDEARSVIAELAPERFAAFYRDNEWLFGMCLVSEACAAVRDPESARVLYEDLAPYAGAHAAGHAEGSAGAVDRYLGLLAATDGRTELAIEHLTQAMAVNERMEAWPWKAHSEVDLAAVLRNRDRPGDAQRAEALVADALEVARRLGMTVLERRVTMDPRRSANRGDERPADEARAAVFRREGDYWTLAFGGESARIRDAKGMRHLSRLIAHPGTEIHALDLVMPFASPAGTAEAATAAAASADPFAGVGPRLDAQAKAAFGERIADLEHEIAEAEASHDLERSAQARAELEFIRRELAGAVGLGGRDRPASAPVERARVSVTRAIRAAMTHVSREMPAFGRHLDATVRTGTYCSYTPDPRVPTVWEL